MNEWNDYFWQLAIDVRNSVAQMPVHVDMHSANQKAEIGDYRGLTQIHLDTYPQPVLVIYALGTEDGDPEDEETPPTELTRIRDALPGLGLEELACHHYYDDPDDLGESDDEDSSPVDLKFGFSLVVQLKPARHENDLFRAAQKLAQLLWAAAE